MKPHRFDPLSFIFGVIFAAASFSLSIKRFNFGGPSLSWVAVGVLLVVGVLMIVTSRSGSRRS